MKEAARLVDTFVDDPWLEDLAAHVQSASRVAAGGLWGSSQALALGALARKHPTPIVALVSTELEAEGFHADLLALGCDATLLPAREEGAKQDPDAVRARLQVAQRLAGPTENRPRLCVASLLSMLQPLPTPGSLEEGYLHLQVGQKLVPDDLLERLVGAGYTRAPLAEEPGELSLRGDILDVFPFAAEQPLRIELFDEEVESLRTFDVDDQRSLEKLDRVSLCIASDAGGVEDGKGAMPASLLAANALWVWIEPLRVKDQRDGLRIRSSAHARALTQLEADEARHDRLELQSLPSGEHDADVRSVQGLGVGVMQAPDALGKLVEDEQRVVVLCRNDAERERFQHVLDDRGGGRGIEIALGTLAQGFRVPTSKLVVVNHRELAGVEGARSAKKERPRHKVRALESFFELRMGDLVVHAVHGVALYQGLELMKRGKGEEEHLHLSFADDVSLYVPATRIDLVQRYVGTGSKAPPRDKLGGSAFRRRKEKVEKALVDMAGELLEVQAKRELERRPAWPVDDGSVRELIDSWPHTDTNDQAVADEEIHKNLTSPHPMDRLLCGDVGYGKTEVAVRAAYRVVNGGGQVAVVVPTTVLAEQHLRTFRERLADSAVRVEMLSRHIKGKGAQQIVADIQLGSVDIAIGTHRLLSKDVRFGRLGLVIIDEEQRFGVTHKEHFKKLRASVDLLTLTATPIPRTLHMSLSGLRDISSLSEPPPGRQGVETKLVHKDEAAFLREAILRERARGGQVFYLHNKVHDIEVEAEWVRSLVPECSYAIGHGQMKNSELSAVMRRFSRGEVDVLVATTIIENGIDIPAAGTILIDDAHRFGLAQLHQLRGRVGRGGHKAYCYLLLERGAALSRIARERLKALEELSNLGAGFQISMKDLELRGAGNLLGTEQSGHIAAVGYDMYCRLLRQCTEGLAAGKAALSGGDAPLTPGEIELELGLPAHLPKSWIPAADARLDLLRRLDAIHSPEEAEEARRMLRDRYGRLPEAAENLVLTFELRATLAAHGISRLSWRDEAWLIEFRDRVALERAFAGDRIELRPVRSGQALIVIPPPYREPAEGVAWLRRMLQRGEKAGKMSAAHD